MNGKSWFFVIMNLLACNGWWYCATQQDTIEQTPIIIIPFIASVIVVIFIMESLYNNWDK